MTSALTEINSLCSAGISKRVVHTMLTELQYQFNLKLASSFAQGMRDLALKEAHLHAMKAHGSVKESRRK